MDSVNEDLIPSAWEVERDYYEIIDTLVDSGDLWAIPLLYKSPRQLRYVRPTHPLAGVFYPKGKSLACRAIDNLEKSGEFLDGFNTKFQRLFFICDEIVNSECKYDDYKDGSVEWRREFYMGSWGYRELLHRENDKPAVIEGNGTRKWYKKGRLFRDGGLPVAISRRPGSMSAAWIRDDTTYTIGFQPDTPVEYIEGFDPVGYDVLSGDDPYVIPLVILDDTIPPPNLDQVIQSQGLSPERWSELARFYNKWVDKLDWLRDAGFFYDFEDDEIYDDIKHALWHMRERVTDKRDSRDNEYEFMREYKKLRIR